MRKIGFRNGWTAMIAVLVAISIAGCQASRQTEAEATPSEQATEKNITLNEGALGELEYLITLPKDYDPNADRSWPVLVFLHFSGGGSMSYAKYYKLYQMVENQGYSFITISPLTKFSWLSNEEDVISIIRNALDQYKADPTRVYLTGGSIGGEAAWTFAAKYPELFAAAAPIASGASTDLAADLVDMPIWAFHNKNDATTKVERTQEMVDAVVNAGGQKIKFTVYEDHEDAKHDAWTKTYHNPDFYKWLLDHANHHASQE